MLTQRNYKITMPRAIAGMLHGTERRTYPRTLAYQAHVERFTVTAGGATTDLAITATDLLTGQVYTFTAPGSANEATLGANVASIFTLDADAQSSGEAAKLFSYTPVQTSDGADLIFDLTARMANRDWSFSVTGGTGAASSTTTQTAGGDGLQFGLMVARDGDDGFDSLSATSVLADCVGVLFRTEANHFHNLENDLGANVVDRSERGWTMPILESGEVWVTAESALTAGGSVYVRRAQTASVGTVGAFRGSETGSAQVDTVTPTASELDFMIQITDSETGEQVPLLSANPDGSATATEICDAFRTAAAAAQADGALSGYTFGGTATLTITGPVGRSFTTRDVGEGVAVVANTTPADVDTINVTSIVEVLKGASAGNLALLRVKRR